MIIYLCCIIAYWSGIFLNILHMTSPSPSVRYSTSSASSPHREYSHTVTVIKPKWHQGYYLAILAKTYFTCYSRPHIHPSILGITHFGQCNITYWGQLTRGQQDLCSLVALALHVYEIWGRSFSGGHEVRDDFGWLFSLDVNNHSLESLLQTITWFVW